MSAGWRRWLAGAALAMAVAGPVAAADAPLWSALGADERQVLATLEADWDRMDAVGRQKWQRMAARFATLAPEDQVRIRARMAEWSRLTPVQRARARQQFLDSRDWPARDRQERWQAYQALSPEQRQALADSALPRANAAAGPPLTPSAPARRNDTSATESSAPQPRAATAVQVRPGATTKPLLVRSAPPLHQHAGMPTIAATPAFVDPATLLPRRGPQGAAMQSAAASAPTGPLR